MTTLDDRNTTLASTLTMTDKEFKITDDPMEGGGGGDDDDDNMGLQEVQEKIDEHDADDDDSDSDSLNVPFLVAGVLDESGGGGGGGKKQKTIPSKPPDDLQWDDNAIISCWNITIASHRNHINNKIFDDNDTKKSVTDKMIVTNNTDEDIPNRSSHYIWKEPILGRKSEVSRDTSSNTTSAVAADAAAVANLLGNWNPKSLKIPMAAAEEEE